MKKILTILCGITVAFNSLIAQNPQLKTFHHFQGMNDYQGLTYTGYEDELGNITYHGTYTFNNGKGTSATFNYKNNVLDGSATIISADPKATCSMKFKDGVLMSISVENSEYVNWDKYIDASTFENIKIAFKYSRNEQGLPIGDYECTYKDRYCYSSIKGRFDKTGKATGNWFLEARDYNIRTKERASFGEMGNKTYFEQGYCLGTNENEIALKKQYLIEHILTEEELLNKGYYYNQTPIKATYSQLKCGVFIKDMITTSDMQDILQQNALFMIECVVYPMVLCTSDMEHANLFKEALFVFNNAFNNAFNDGFVTGSPISYMSNELYQNIVNQIKSGNLQENMTPKYDENLHKYYLLKADGKSRLYIPLETEKEFEGLYILNK